MKTFFFVIGLCVLMFSCGDEECLPLRPGNYKATLGLIEEGCNLNAPKTFDLILEYPEGNSFLQCGRHESVNTEFDLVLQCTVISKMSVETTGQEIVGEFTITLVCSNKNPCTDKFNFSATRILN